MDLLPASLRAPLCLPVGWDVPPSTGSLPGTQVLMAGQRWPTSWTILVTPTRFMWSPDRLGCWEKWCSLKKRVPEEKRWGSLENCASMLYLSVWLVMGLAITLCVRMCTLLLNCSWACWYFGVWLGWQPISPA
jgi:hypothetical protein